MGREGTSQTTINNDTIKNTSYNNKIFENRIMNETFVNSKPKLGFIDFKYQKD